MLEQGTNRSKETREFENKELTVRKGLHRACENREQNARKRVEKANRSTESREC